MGARASRRSVEEGRVIVVIVAGVGGFWILLTALVKRDRGWVGISDRDRARIRIVVAFGLAIDVIADLLTPAFRKTALALERFYAEHDQYLSETTESE